ncbi:hypothetical protein [Microbacterium invictum]|uniref:Fibronectin type-III domain-containing protein n=1 Tax=Microbacterium invictum TaxID=515415 RepID=A0ABZ0VGL6_9MICO|nr:hypothetical protein [Microbacterium invictum]WQB71957.1 hypothetical protein T9R20_08440 [Microbacterium invictum]
MAYSEGQLNGGADYRVGIDVWYSGVQDWDANTSRFDWRVVLQRGSDGFAWSGSTQYWSASIGGVNYNGTFTLNQNEATTATRVVGAGSTWHGHDSEGYRPGFPSNAYIDTNHGNVGDGGSGDAWVDAPRIPKTPAAPHTVYVDLSTIRPSSFGVRYTRGDNRGAGIDYDHVQWATDSGFTNVVWNDTPPNGNPNGYSNPSGVSPAVKLRPGTIHYVRARSHNTRGWSPWSSTVNARTLSGAYVWNGTEWRPCEVLVWSGTAWVTGEVSSYTGTEWKQAS